MFLEKRRNTGMKLAAGKNTSGFLLFMNYEVASRSIPWNAIKYAATTVVTPRSNARAQGLVGL